MFPNKLHPKYFMGSWMSCSQARDTGRDEKEFFCECRGENKRQNDGIRGVFVYDWVFLSEYTDAVCLNRALQHIAYWCRCAWYFGIALHVVWLKTHFTLKDFVLPSTGLFNKGKHTSSAAALSGLQRWGEFSCTMIPTDRPTIPVVFKISTMSLHTPCEGERKTEREESYFFFLS